MIDDTPDYLLRHRSMQRHTETIEDGVRRVLSDGKPHTVYWVCQRTRFSAKQVVKLLFRWEALGMIERTGGEPGKAYWWRLKK